MQSKLMIVVAASLAILCLGTADAADKGILNTPKEEETYKYWAYRVRLTDKKNPRTEARLLHIKEGDIYLYPYMLIEAKLWRYKTAGNSGRYILHRFGIPNVTHVKLKGFAKCIEPKPDTVRQRQWEFLLVGQYKPNSSETRQIELAGYFHPGANTAPADTVGHASRIGDRIVLRTVADEEVKYPLARSLSTSSILRIARSLQADKTLKPDERDQLLQGLIEAFFKMYTTDPCDEQADDDVMEEEALPEDPETEDPMPEVPTEP